MNEAWAAGLSWSWFGLTYVGLALGRIPGLRIDRTGITLVGAALVLATGLLTFDQAVAAVNFATLALLFGMMIVVAFLRQAGFFQGLTRWALARITTPRGLLATVLALSGLLSALLVNDVVCVALTPLVVAMTRRLRIDPKPHLLALALAANIGSTATLTGNPQNMMIGTASGIPYLRFALKLAPVAIVGLLIAYVVLLWTFRTALRPGIPAPQVAEAPARPLSFLHRRLLVKSVLVTIAAVILFCLNAPLEIVSLGAAAVLLLDRVNPEKIFRHVDFGLLVMFAGLFVVVHAFEVQVVRGWHVEQWAFLHDSPIVLLSLVSAALSNLVSNVPAVLLFTPIIPVMPEPVQETAWLALAMSSTLAGNLTVLGSVANLIVVEKARREGVSITFGEYLRVGVPVTILTLGLGLGWLYVTRN